MPSSVPTGLFSNRLTDSLTMNTPQLEQFTQITGAREQQARFYLDAAGGDLETAVATYYEQQGTAEGAPPAGADDDASAASQLQAQAQAQDSPMTGGANSNSNDDEEADLAAAIAASTSTSTAQPSPQQQQQGGGGGAGGGLERGAYTLSGAPAPALPAAWGGAAGGGSGGHSGASSRSATPSNANPMRSNQPPRVTGFRDLASASSGSAPRGGGGGGGMGRVQHGGGGDDADDDDDEGGKQQQEFFAGGEKSGLSVQNPNAQGGNKAEGMIKGILQKAKDGGSRMAGGLAGLGGGGGSSGPQRQVFTGGAHTLGSDEVPSTFIPATSTSSSSSRMPGSLQDSDDDDDDEEGMDEGVDPTEPTAIRTLTFWQDGFSIDDGDLRDYQDPANQEILRAIDGGRAPLSLLRVRHDQPVELRVAKRLSEQWSRQPSAPKGAWEGEGRRLGSVDPTPSVSISTAATGGAGLGQAQRQPQGATAFEVDLQRPTTQLQIRLRDGERMIARFNHSHTVGDIRAYINASQPGAASNPYALQTTFPSRDLTDDAQTIEQAGLLGSVVVQRGL